MVRRAARRAQPKELGVLVAQHEAARLGSSPGGCRQWYWVHVDQRRAFQADRVIVPIGAGVEAARRIAKCQLAQLAVSDEGMQRVVDGGVGDPR